MEGQKNSEKRRSSYFSLQGTYRFAIENNKDGQFGLWGGYHFQDKGKSNDDSKIFARIGVAIIQEKTNPLVVNQSMAHGSLIYFLDANKKSFLGVGANFGAVFANLNQDLSPYHLNDPLLDPLQPRFNSQLKEDAGVFYQGYFNPSGKRDIFPFVGVAVQNFAQNPIAEKIANHSIPLARLLVINTGLIFSTGTNKFLEVNVLAKRTSTPLFYNTAFKCHHYDWKIFQVLGLGFTARPNWETIYLCLERDNNLSTQKIKIGLMIYAPLNRPISQLFGPGFEVTTRYRLSRN